MYEIGVIRNVKTEKRCPVKGCTSTSLNRRISFHKLPKNVEIANQWMNLLNIPRHSPVCSMHFDPNDFIPHSKSV